MSNLKPSNAHPLRNHRTGRIAAQMAAPAALALVPGVASASFLPPELMDAAAMYLAWFVVIFVPIGAIVLFWMVHVLPEKIAHKRHHPQRDAIQVLCLLSLVFGGLLWPIAWLWAYVRPVSYKMAYGTDKHEDYFHEAGEKLAAGGMVADEIRTLRRELDEMHARGALPPKLVKLRDDIEELARQVEAERGAEGQGTGAA